MNLSRTANEQVVVEVESPEANQKSLSVWGVGYEFINGGGILRVETVEGQGVLVPADRVYYVHDRRER